MSAGVKLGQKVTDCITGWSGIAWARVTYLVGEDQIGVMSKAENGNPGGVQYFEEERLMAASAVELSQLRSGVGGEKG